MGVVSLMGYAGVTEGFLCAHPNVIVIVFKGRVKQDLQPEVCLHHCKHFA